MRDAKWCYRASVVLLILLVGCEPIPEGVTVWYESPSVVVLGDSFEIIAHVENASEATVVLSSIDIGDSFLAGIQVDRSDPVPYDLYHLPIDNTMSYVYDIDVPPSQDFSVTFHARAVAQGIQSGSFDFCVNSHINCDRRTISTRVENQ